MAAGNWTQLVQAPIDLSSAIVTGSTATLTVTAVTSGVLKVGHLGVRRDRRHD